MYVLRDESSYSCIIFLRCFSYVQLLSEIQDGPNAQTDRSGRAIDDPLHSFFGAIAKDHTIIV